VSRHTVGMNPRTIASVAAVVGGVGWLLEVVLIAANGGSNTDGGLVGVMYLVGLLGLVVALAAAGYTLVETAPVWLRAVVVVATPLLVFMVWQMIDQAIKALDAGDGWLGDELDILLAGVIALALGAWGLARRRSAAGRRNPTAAPKSTRGRRAAR
jgi:hypothetical protein